MAQPGMDDMYAVDGQRHAWAGHSCGAVQDQALKFFPYASPSGKAEGSADKSKICVDLDKLFKYGIQHQQFTEVDFVSSGWVSPVFAPRRPSGADLAAMAAAGTLPPVNPVSWHMKPD